MYIYEAPISITYTLGPFRLIKTLIVILNCVILWCIRHCVEPWCIGSHSLHCCCDTRCVEPRLSAHACKHFREELWRLSLTLYPSGGALTCLPLRYIVVAVKYSNCDTNNNRHYDVPTIGHRLSYKRCVHQHRTLLFIDSILCSSPHRLQLGGHDSREGDGPLWQTGVGRVRLSLHRDVRTSVYWLFYTGRIYRRE